MVKNLVEYLLSATETDKGIYFIKDKIDEFEFITYKELYNSSLKRLAKLQELGMKPKDELLILIEDNKEFMSYLWGALLGGIIAVPLKVSEKKEDLLRVSNVIEKMDHPLLVINNKMYIKLMKYFDDNRLANLHNKINRKVIIIESIQISENLGSAVDIQQDDIGIIQFSSGSTGIPKGVILTHKNLVSGVNDIITSSCLCKDDIYMSWLPLTHNMGLIGLHLSPVATRSNQIFMPATTFMRNPLSWLQVVNKFRVSRIAGPNFAYRVLIDLLKIREIEELDLSCIKEIYNGSEPVSMDLVNSLYKELSKYKLKYNTLYPVYGLAEATLGVTFPKAFSDPLSVVVDRRHLNIGEQVEYLSSKEDKNAAEYAVVGYPLEHCELIILDEENNKLQEGYIGIIYIKGDSVTPGYYHVNDNIYNDEGWYCTGDIGFITNGQLVVTGRKKEIIFVCGHNFYPFDVERVCTEYTGIKPDSIVACGNYNHKENKDEMLIFIAAKSVENELCNISGKVKQVLWDTLGVPVDKVIFVDEIPKSSGTKIARYKLIENYKEGKYDNVLINKIEDKTHLEETGKTKQIILKAIYNLLGIEQFDVNENIISLGLTSVIAVKLFNELDVMFPGKLTLANLFTNPTVKQLADFIDYDGIMLKTCAMNNSLKFENIDGNIITEILENNVSRSILEISKQKSIDVYHIVSCIIAYIISNFNKNDKISFQIMNIENICHSIDLDLTGLEDLYGLIDVYKKSFDSSVKYNFFDIEKLKVSSDDNNILILIYEYKNEVQTLDEFKYFKLSIGVECKENELVLHYACSNEYFINQLSKNFSAIFS